MVLPTNTTNDTEQFDTHPGLHNDANARINALDAQFVTGASDARVRALDATGDVQLDGESVRRRKQDTTDLGPLLAYGQVGESYSSAPTTITDTAGAWAPISASGTLALNPLHPEQGAVVRIDAMCTIRLLRDAGGSGDGGCTVELWARGLAPGPAEFWLSTLEQTSFEDWAVERNVQRTIRSVGLLKIPPAVTLMQYDLRVRVGNIVGDADKRQYINHGIRVTELVL